MSNPISTRGAGAADTDDVVEVILADHRLFEELIRALRNREEDRAARLVELADVLVAHAVAEEDEVYPNLARRAPEESEEIEHGTEEHAEGHEALLALQVVEDVDSPEFEDALEHLSEMLSHHVDEEERDVLNAAREHVPDDVRQRLGQAFLRRRNELLDGHPGDPRNVGRLVSEAERDDLL